MNHKCKRHSLKYFKNTIEELRKNSSYIGTKGTRFVIHDQKMFRSEVDGKLVFESDSKYTQHMRGRNSPQW